MRHVTLSLVLMLYISTILYNTVFDSKSYLELTYVLEVYISIILYVKLFDSRCHTYISSYPLLQRYTICYTAWHHHEAALEELLREESYKNFLRYTDKNFPGKGPRGAL